MKVIDLFAGAGGFSEGFRRAGFEIVFANEIEKEMVETYNCNHENVDISHKDIRDLTPDDIDYGKEEIDIIIGGPPCQGFSTVGDRREDDTRNSLFKEYLRIVSHFQPKFILMENVEGILSMEDGKIKDKILRELKNMGKCYDVDYHVLNSANYSIPQKRKRVFFMANNLGLKNKVPDKETYLPKEKDSLLSTKLRRYRTVEDAIGDLSSLSPGEKKEEYNKPPQTKYQKNLRGNTNVLYNHEASSHGKKVLKRLSEIPPGGNHSDLPAELQLSSGYPNIYGRLEWKKPADTMTGNCGCISAPGRFIHPEQDRGITVREAARLQSFPDSYEFKGNKGMQYKQVGNAVPPLLAQKIAFAIKDMIR